MLTLNNDNFQAEVLDSDKPVVVDFWATWCGPCRMFSPVMDEVAGEMTDVAFGKVNVDDAPELAQKFDVMSIPTVIMFKGGEPVKRSTGAMSKEGLVAWIQE